MPLFSNLKVHRPHRQPLNVSEDGGIFLDQTHGYAPETRKIMGTPTVTEAHIHQEDRPVSCLWRRRTKQPWRKRTVCLGDSSLHFSGPSQPNGVQEFFRLEGEIANSRPVWPGAVTKEFPVPCGTKWGTQGFGFSHCGAGSFVVMDVPFARTWYPVQGNQGLSFPQEGSQR